MKDKNKMSNLVCFKNEGNDCYFNSVIQALLNTDTMNSMLSTNKFDNNKLPLKILRIINNLKHIVINPITLKNEFASFDSESYLLFGNKDQQDAHEAILKILDIVHNYTKYNMRESEYEEFSNDANDSSYSSWINSNRVFGYSFVTRYFNGQFKNSIKCRHCKHESFTYDNFGCLELSINDDSTNNSIITGLQRLVKPEFIRDARCSNCSNMGIIKTTTILRFPYTLIICIKRYKYDDNYNMIKCNNVFSIDRSFEVVNTSSRFYYGIKTIVYHHGTTPNSGHYNVDMYKDKQWYRIDDEVVVPLRNINTDSNNCYLMVYEMIDE